MTTLPIPLTKATLIAVVVLVVLIAVKLAWALWFVVGWSLGGDGAVFRQVRTFCSEWITQRRRT